MSFIFLVKHGRTILKVKNIIKRKSLTRIIMEYTLLKKLLYYQFKKDLKKLRLFK